MGAINGISMGVYAVVLAGRYESSAACSEIRKTRMDDFARGSTEISECKFCR